MARVNQQAHFRWKRALAATLSLFISAAGGAQHSIILAKLRGWNDAAPAPAITILGAEVLKAAIAVQKRDGGCLPTLAVIDSVSPATAERYIFNRLLRGQLRNGWTMIVHHPNCGTGVTRYMTIQQADGTLNTVRVNRGMSYAHDSLIGDTLPLATLGTQAALTRAGIACQSTTLGTLGIIRIADKAADLGADVYGVRYTGSWSEIWPVTTCGKTVEMRVKFTTDGDGGAYSEIDGSAAKIVPATN